MYGFKIPKKVTAKTLPTKAQLKGLMISTSASNITELVVEINKAHPSTPVDGNDIVEAAKKFRNLMRKVKGEIERGETPSDAAIAAELKNLGVKKIEVVE